MRILPKKVLCWESFLPNEIEGITGWEWAYVPKSSRPHRLSVGGGDVPDPEFRGINLVGVRYTSNIQERKFQRKLDKILPKNKD